VAIEHNPDLLFSRVMLPGCPPDVADKRFGRPWREVGFLSYLRSLRATMSQKSSVPQAVSFVSAEGGHLLGYRCQAQLDGP
jgi:hypothetical protein